MSLSGLPKSMVMVAFLLGLLVPSFVSSPYSWFPSSSRHSHFKKHQDDLFNNQAGSHSLESPLRHICLAHESIALLYKAMPDTVPTLFGVLRLDPSTHPFHPPENCAMEGDSNYNEARVMIENAWLDLQPQDLSNIDLNGRHVAATNAAAALLNDDARTIYLRDILPQIKNMDSDWWKTTCDTKSDSTW